jgi:hypothetical protein
MTGITALSYDLHNVLLKSYMMQGKYAVIADELSFTS